MVTPLSRQQGMRLVARAPIRGATHDRPHRDPMHYATYASCALLAICGAIFVYLGLWCAAVKDVGRHAGITLIGLTFVITGAVTAWFTYA